MFPCQLVEKEDLVAKSVLCSEFGATWIVVLGLDAAEAPVVKLSRRLAEGDKLAEDQKVLNMTGVMTAEGPPEVVLVVVENSDDSKWRKVVDIQWLNLFCRVHTLPDLAAAQCLFNWNR